MSEKLTFAGFRRLETEQFHAPALASQLLKARAKMRPDRILLVFFAALICNLHGQVTVSAVVNAASYTVPVEPGSVISIFGSNLAAAAASASGFPLATILAGTSVSINGLPSPLLSVSPGQINAQIPSSLQSRTDYGTATVIVTAPAGTSAPFQFQTAPAGPGIFTLDQSGCGAAAALNVAPDGSVSINSSSNSAQPGDYLTVFGTGLGPPGVAVVDGTPAPGPDPISPAAGANLGYGAVGQLGSGSQPYVTYGGLAPGMAGVDQMNVLIQQDVTQGCAVPLTVGGFGFEGPTVSVSIHSGRGQCVDPPVSSYGQITLTRTIRTGTASDGESDAFAALFPSGPNIQPPAPPTMQTLMVNTGAAVPPSRTCTLPGVANLSAGNLTIQPNGKPAVVISPQSQQGGFLYRQELPAGFVQPGPYTVSSATGAPVSFSSTFSVGSSIQIQTNLNPGMVLSASQGFHLAWSGGDAGALVHVQLVYQSPLGDTRADSYWSRADAGSLAFSGICSPFSPHQGQFCGWGFPMTNQGEVIVDVLPLGAVAVTTPAAGLTQGVQITWVYRYVFGEISFTP